MYQTRNRRHGWAGLQAIVISIPDTACPGLGKNAVVVVAQAEMTDMVRGTEKRSLCHCNV